MTKDTNSKPKEVKTVTVAHKAFMKICLHSTTHSYNSIHGILIGFFDKEKQMIRVEDAFPVCHGVVTMPIVEIATAMVKVQQEKNQSTIVGWYTAPELLDDSKPGPTALRMVSCLAEASKEMDPTLLVLNNQALSAFIKSDKNTVTDLIQAFGRDFGDQWLSSVSISMSNDPTDIKSLRNQISSGVVMNDLLDHLNGSAPLSWDPNNIETTMIDS